MAVAADKLCVGMITKAHGIKGYVCVHSYCNNPLDKHILNLPVQPLKYF